MTEHQPSASSGHLDVADADGMGKRKLVETAIVDRDASPARFRELAVIALLVALFDLVVFRGHGYAGYALGFVIAPVLLWAGAPRRGLLIGLVVVFAMLALLAIRMAWLGTAPQILAGLILIAAFATALSGRVPYVLDSLLLGWQLTFAGIVRFPVYARMRRTSSPGVSRDLLLKVLMPAGVVLIFSLVFVQANPDLKASIDRLFGAFRERLDELFGELMPSLPQFVLWGVVAWLSIGLLRPLLLPRVLGWLGPIVDGRPDNAAGAERSALVPAFRNTLIAVISLFAIYLAFEFQTLWFREFPKGFYYAGYAHEGAAWLTVALALATLVLSAIFRGGVLTDGRLPSLKRLAFAWSVLNVVLAIAVYHRLSIYIGFNGMTRMRTVGIVGVSTVLVGFLLVVWKIARDRGFLWLIERQLWALSIGLYVLAVLPMDALIHRYNVARILAGDPAPSVQITAHDVDVTGLAALTPLLNCDDPVIRDGIAARFAGEWYTRSVSDDLETRHWTAYQRAERDFHTTLERLAPRFADFAQSHSSRDDAWRRFRSYAYQWY